MDNAFVDVFISEDDTIVIRQTADKVYYNENSVQICMDDIELDVEDAQELVNVLQEYISELTN